MSFVYHLVSDDFRGEHLLPLLALETAYPDVYARERIKYEGRESVLDYEVPGLGATWGWTVNLAAFDPSHLVAERCRLGVPFSRLLQRRVVRIPIERLRGLPAVVYEGKTLWINAAPGTDAPLTPPAHEFTPLDLVTYTETAAVPQLHLEYLEQSRDTGQPALGFVYVPHVLVAAPVDISGLDRVPLTELVTGGD